MKKFIFIISMSLAAISQGIAAEAQSISAPVKNTPVKADTIISYSIDGQAIKHFTGQELVGKTVKLYDIHYASVPSSNTVLEIHDIKTTDSPKSTDKEIHYIIDGKELSKAEIDKISADKIQSVSVFKEGSKAAQQYGKDGNYIVITLKK